MRNEPSIEERVLELARRHGILRARDMEASGVHPECVRRMCRKGLLRRVGRGLYALPETEPSAHHGLALVSKRTPQAVGCLLTALQFHEIGTQAPFEVWIALERRMARPRIDYPPLRVMRFSGPALSEGIEEHEVEGVCVRVYCPAKTVADCFKYRNKIGLDVALEALREGLRQRKCASDDLWRFAKVCRVTTVMRPYMEAMP